VNQHTPDWRRRIEELLDRDESEPIDRFAQLATVRADGSAACRTVGFRGFMQDDPADRLLVCTDARSRKVPQLQAERRAELCWYIATAREQFRIAGPCACVCQGYPNDSLQAARVGVWKELSEGTRAAFFGPQPGEDRAPESAFEPPPDLEEMPANFCLLVLKPERVIHLRLVPGPDERTVYTAQDDGEWKCRAVNP
jgi:PPOX class probable FMN-dependent enzyme